LEIRPTPPPKEIMHPLKIQGDKPKKENEKRQNPNAQNDSKKEKKDRVKKKGENLDFFA